MVLCKREPRGNAAALLTFKIDEAHHWKVPSFEPGQYLPILLEIHRFSWMILMNCIRLTVGKSKKKHILSVLFFNSSLQI